MIVNMSSSSNVTAATLNPSPSDEVRGVTSEEIRGVTPEIRGVTQRKKAIRSFIFLKEKFKADGFFDKLRSST